MSAGGNQVVQPTCASATNLVHFDNSALHGYARSKLMPGSHDFCFPTVPSIMSIEMLL